MIADVTPARPLVFDRATRGRCPRSAAAGSLASSTPAALYCLIGASIGGPCIRARA
jgi:hypothetical protein